MCTKFVKALKPQSVSDHRCIGHEDKHVTCGYIRLGSVLHHVVSNFLSGMM